MIENNRTICPRCKKKVDLYKFHIRTHTNVYHTECATKEDMKYGAVKMTYGILDRLDGYSN